MNRPRSLFVGSIEPACLFEEPLFLDAIESMRELKSFTVFIEHHNFSLLEPEQLRKFLPRLLHPNNKITEVNFDTCDCEFDPKYLTCNACDCDADCEDEPENSSEKTEEHAWLDTKSLTLHTPCLSDLRLCSNLGGSIDNWLKANSKYKTLKNLCVGGFYYTPQSVANLIDLLWTQPHIENLEIAPFVQQSIVRSVGLDHPVLLNEIKLTQNKYTLTPLLKRLQSDPDLLLQQCFFAHPAVNNLCLAQIKNCKAFEKKAPLIQGTILQVVINSKTHAALFQKWVGSLKKNEWQHLLDILNKIKTEPGFQIDWLKNIENHIDAKL